MSNSYLMGMLSGTPWWVWGVFAYLLWIGSNATKARTVYVPRLFIIPAILFAFKVRLLLAGDPALITYYVMWFLVGAGIGYYRGSRTTIMVLKDTTSIVLPGSYETITLLMIFFAVKYIFGFLQATNPLFAQQYFGLELAISALFSGYFLAKSLAYVRKFLQAR